MSGLSLSQFASRPGLSSERMAVLADVAVERNRQEHLYPNDQHQDLRSWHLVLGAELGEVPLDVPQQRRWPRHAGVVRCLGARHKPRHEKTPGLCQQRTCLEWPTNEVFSYGTGIIQRLCDRCFDGYRAALRSVGWDPEQGIEVRYFEAPPRSHLTEGQPEP